MTGGSMDIQFPVDLRGSGTHVAQSEALTFRQAGTGDSRSIIFYLKDEIRSFPAKRHADHRRPGMANGVADRLLGKTQQFMAYARRETLFGNVVGPELTAQPARHVRVFNQTLQRRRQARFLNRTGA